jgi:hypothetical protein
MDFEGGWSNRDKGEYTIQFEALRAGKMHLYIWCTLDENTGRQLFPGAPFKLVVIAGEVDFQVSTVGDMLIERNMQIKDNPSEKVILPYRQGSKIIAGDVIIFRPYLVDRHHNIANLDSAKLEPQLFGPTGELLTSNLHVESIVKNEHTQGFEVRHSTDIFGDYTLKMRFGEIEIRGSPCEYFVTRAEFFELNTILEPQGFVAGQPMMIDQEYHFLARLRDRFGNHVDKGGENARARLIHVKQGLHDSTELHLDNHKVEVEDQHDGTYLVQLELISSGGHLNHFPIAIEMYFILDDEDDSDFDPSRRKDNLPPLKLTFLKNEAASMTKAKSSSDSSKKLSPDGFPMAKSSNEFSIASASKGSHASSQNSLSTAKKMPAPAPAPSSHSRRSSSKPRGLPTLAGARKSKGA